MTYSRCKRIDLQTILEARNHTNHPSQNSPRGPHFVPNQAYRKRPARSISVSPSSPSIQAFHSLRLAKTLTSKPLQTLKPPPSISNNHGFEQSAIPTCQPPALCPCPCPPPFLHPSLRKPASSVSHLVLISDVRFRSAWLWVRMRRLICVEGRDLLISGLVYSKR